MNIFETLKNKIFSIIGRGIVAIINNSGSVQKLQIKGFKNETVTDIERIEEYGFTTYPKSDAEAIALFAGGNRDQGIVIAIGDKRYRLTTLSEGDVAVYDYRGNKIVLSSSGIIATDYFGNKIRMEALGITLETGDAVTWKQNILPIDPLTGLPHGGITAGIIKLKGA